MDWGRAKSYLIVAFLLLDLLLGYQYWGVRAEEANYVQSYADQLHDVKEELNARHIQLAIEIPKNTPNLGFLHVKYDTTDPKVVAQRAVDDIDVNTIVLPGVPLVTDTASFLYQQPGIYQKQFQLQSQHLLSVNLADSKGVDHLKELLSSHLWRGNEYEPDLHTLETGKRTQVRFFQMYKEYPLFSAPILVQINEANVVESYTQYCLSIIQEEGDKRPVIPALNAIHSFVDFLPALPNPGANGTVTADKNTAQPKPTVQEETKILDIRLGYYSNKRFSIGENEWYLAPMWRILTDKGSYYVNGITGEVQREERE